MEVNGAGCGCGCGCRRGFDYGYGFDACAGYRPRPLPGRTTDHSQGHSTLESSLHLAGAVLPFAVVPFHLQSRIGAAWPRFSTKSAIRSETELTPRSSAASGSKPAFEGSFYAKLKGTKPQGVQGIM